MYGKLGTVSAIYTAPRMGIEMVPTDQVMAIAGKGLEGDRYAEGLGAYSRSKVPKVRHVSLIAREAIKAANDSLEVPYDEAETRRNIITDGVELDDLIGEEFVVGYVVMRGVEACDPCKRPEKLSGKEGFEAAFRDLGGIRAEVLTTGRLAVGDSIGW